MSDAEAVLRSLFRERIDHSALFPPTALSFEEAIRKTALFPSSLRRPYIIASEMVIPEERMQQIDADTLKINGFNEALFRLSLLGALKLSDADGRKFKSNLKVIEDFNSSRGRQNPPQKIISYEFKLSPDEESKQEALADLLKYSSEHAQQEGLRIFIEPDLSRDNWHGLLDRISDLLSQVSADNSFGLKVRTSGPTGLKRERLAVVLERINALKLPFKVTGGLHYPFAKGENPTGFFALTAAVAFSRKFQLSPQEITGLLSVSSADEFKIADSLSYGRYSIDAEDIARGFTDTHFTIGCCNPTIQDNELARLFPD